MTGSDARRTGRWMILAVGLTMLVAAGLFLKLAYDKADPAVDQNAVNLLLAGVAAIVLAELLPLLQNIKFGGVEVEFRDLGEDLTNDIQGLKARLSALEAAAAAAPVAAAAVTSAADALDQRGPVSDDPRKGQFGSQSRANGLLLRAEFPGRKDARWAKVVLIVEPDSKDSDLSDIASVEFFLHDSFNEPRVTVPVRNGVARLPLTAWGGFTVGVWIPARNATLELDLAEIKSAPRVIREL